MDKDTFNKMHSVCLGCDTLYLNEETNKCSRCGSKEIKLVRELSGHRVDAIESNHENEKDLKLERLTGIFVND